MKFVLLWSLAVFQSTFQTQGRGLPFFTLLFQPPGDLMPLPMGVGPPEWLLLGWRISEPQDFALVSTGDISQGSAQLLPHVVFCPPPRISNLRMSCSTGVHSVAEMPRAGGACLGKDPQVKSSLICLLLLPGKVLPSSHHTTFLLLPRHHCPESPNSPCGSWPVQRSCL